MLICTRSAIAVVAISTFHPEPEENALLGRLSPLAEHARVCAREASLAFLKNVVVSQGGTRERGRGEP